MLDFLLKSFTLTLMKYTHSYRKYSAFTDWSWPAFKVNLRHLLNRYADKINLSISGIDDNSDQVSFYATGRGDSGVAIVSRGREFRICDTSTGNRSLRPETALQSRYYNELVIEFFKLIRAYLPDTVLESTGGVEVFNGKRIVVNNKYTYFTGDHEVEVGDIVTLPSAFKDNHTWEGTVTAIGSKYAGDCKTILGVETCHDADEQIDADGTGSADEEITELLRDSGMDYIDAMDASRKILLLIAKRLGIK